MREQKKISLQCLNKSILDYIVVLHNPLLWQQMLSFFYILLLESYDLDSKLV